MNSQTLMRGGTNLRKAYEDFLRSTIPDRLVIARQQWGLEDWELPDPVKYDADDPLKTNVYPTLGSYLVESSNWVRNDIDPYAEEVYQPTYQLRGFLWVRTPERPDGSWDDPGRGSAMRLRDDYLAIVRSLILQTPSLGTNGSCRVEEGSLTEDYLDGMSSGNENSRWMFGGIISFNVTFHEANYLEEIGTVENTTVETEVVGLMEEMG